MRRCATPSRAVEVCDCFGRTPGNAWHRSYFLPLNRSFKFNKSLVYFARDLGTHSRPAQGVLPSAFHRLRSWPSGRKVSFEPVKWDFERLTFSKLPGESLMQSLTLVGSTRCPPKVRALNYSVCQGLDAK